jgi:hypothetical protein
MERNRSILLLLTLLAAGCTLQYRQDYEIDARGQAANACHAAGIGADDKRYYDCFQGQLTKLMAVAPTASRPVAERQPTDWDMCQSYGLTYGSDAFGVCLQNREHSRQQAAVELLRVLTPTPSISCRSVSVGRVTTTRCY